MCPNRSPRLLSPLLSLILFCQWRSSLFCCSSYPPFCPIHSHDNPLCNPRGTPLHSRGRFPPVRLPFPHKHILSSARERVFRFSPLCCTSHPSTSFFDLGSRHASQRRPFFLAQGTPPFTISTPTDYTVSFVLQVGTRIQNGWQNILHITVSMDARLPRRESPSRCLVPRCKSLFSCFLVRLPCGVCSARWLACRRLASWWGEKGGGCMR